MHEAEQYLRNPDTPNSLYVQYGGGRRRLFFNPTKGQIGMIDKGCSKTGHLFNNWSGVTKVFYPDDPDNEQKAIERERRLTAKYTKQASKATHTNPFIRKCLAADPGKTPYKNGLSTGTRIDGKLISLKTIEKYAGSNTMNAFRRAVAEKRHFASGRFDFQGYDGSLSVQINTAKSTYFRPGDVMAYFDKEYRGCANGYYYLLINDEYFIGYDID
jgi:hypothetical protein